MSGGGAAGIDGRNPIDALFDALADGDLVAARDALRPDALVWHGFDQIALTVDELLAQWETLIAGSRARFVTDVRRQDTAGGHVQQHLFVIEQPSGQRLAWPVCIVVGITGGRIARLDEYIDRAGHFAPSDASPTTPGFARL